MSLQWVLGSWEELKPKTECMMLAAYLRRLKGAKPGHDQILRQRDKAEKESPRFPAQRGKLCTPQANKSKVSTMVFIDECPIGYLQPNSNPPSRGCVSDMSWWNQFRVMRTPAAFLPLTRFCRRSRYCWRKLLGSVKDVEN